jgi:3-hydroxybutyrate dehydrogenase
MTLAGQHAVVTGGGTGIGAAIGRALVAADANVTIIGRREDRLRSVARETGAAIAVADLTDPHQVDAAFATARAAHGPVTILIANAGAAHTAAFDATAPADWHAMIAANLTTVFLSIRAALPDLRTAGQGRILAVASTAALRGYAYSSAYAAAKHGVLGVVRSLALELATTPITVNALCPGFTDTDLVDRAVDTIRERTGRDAASARAALARFNPQGRLIDADDVAQAALWLCQPSSARITGQAISISGGETM